MFIKKIKEQITTNNDCQEIRKERDFLIKLLEDLVEEGRYLTNFHPSGEPQKTDQMLEAEDFLIQHKLNKKGAV